MQFIYVDESGTGKEPIGVMVGVIANAYRMKPTKMSWNNLLASLSSIVGRQVGEIHTRDFYSGNSPWRELDGHQRSQIINAIFNWLKDRKHSIVYCAVDKTKFLDTFHAEPAADDISTLWTFMALHLALSIQKYFQGSPRARGRKRTINPKGTCVFFFDNEYTEQKRFTDLFLNAPDWVDTYYDRKPDQEKFSQIVDVPHFVDSKDVALIQLADFICFFLRKHIELEMEHTTPDYDDEVEKVTNWANLILNQGIPKNNIYLSRRRCDCADLFYRYAPDIIK